MVYGAPLAEKHGIWRDLASVITKATLATVMNVGSARHVSAFRVFYTRLRDAFVQYTGPVGIPGRATHLGDFPFRLRGGEA